MVKDDGSQPIFGLIRVPSFEAKKIHEIWGLDSVCLGEYINSAMSNPRTRESLYLASPPLFKRLLKLLQSDLSFDKLYVSAAKYLLRMAYRPTPFGFFSHVGSYEAAYGKDITKINVDEKNIYRHSRLASDLIYEIFSGVEIESDWGSFFVLNSTLHTSGTTATFLSYDSNDKGQRTYKKVEVNLTHHLQKLIDLSKNCLPLSELAEQLSVVIGVGSDEINPFLKEAVRLQILTMDQLYDLTSKNILADSMKYISPHSKYYSLIDSINVSLQNIDVKKRVATEDYDLISNQLLSKNIGKKNRNSPVHVDSFLADKAQTFVDKKHIDKIQKIVSTLGRYAANPSIEKFINFFENWYGESQISMLSALEDNCVLDALGYLPQKSYLFNTLHVGLKSFEKSVYERKIEEFLGQILDEKILTNCDHYISAAENEDFRITGDSDSFWKVERMVVFSLWQKKVGEKKATCIEVKQIINHPERMMGRFAWGSDSAADLVSGGLASIADDGLDVEILHVAHNDLINICSHPAFSPYEIRLRAGGSETASIIPLNDIYVYVENKRICLRSKSLNKKLKMHMSNAHIHASAQFLPIYRFLNLIACQEEKISLPSLREIFPEARFVPGLIVGDVIISRPTWRVDDELIMKLKKQNKCDRRYTFKALAKEIKLPEEIAFVSGDNSIPLKLSQTWMVDELIKLIIRGNKFFLTDVFPHGMLPAVDSGGGAHFHELQHVYQPIRAISNAKRSNKELFLDLSEVRPSLTNWLYYCVYSPINCQNIILSCLKNSLENWIQEKLISGFFFVRYKDHEGNHLRLRFNIINGDAFNIINGNLISLFNKLCMDGLVSKVSIVPYLRELERYGGNDCCFLCEKIFCIDSLVVLRSLQFLDSNGQDFWPNAVVAVDQMLSSLGVKTIDEKLQFARYVISSLSKNLYFNYDKGKLRSIFTTYDVYKLDQNIFFEGLNVVENLSVINKDIFDLWTTIKNRFSLSADELRISIIHMRINRICNLDARFQEDVLWDLLKRCYSKVLYGTAV